MQSAKLQFSSRKIVNLRIGKLILIEESVRRKTAGELQLEIEQRNAFVAEWKEKRKNTLLIFIPLWVSRTVHRIDFLLEYASQRCHQFNSQLSTESGTGRRGTHENRQVHFILSI